MGVVGRQNETKENLPEKTFTKLTKENFSKKIENSYREENLHRKFSIFYFLREIF